MSTRLSLGKGLRRITVAVVILVSILAFIPDVGAQGGDTFVWGERFSSAQYWGVDTYMSFPDASISGGQFVSGPNAVSNRKGGQPDLAFIESGPWKNCQSGADCKLHPYGTWRATNGTGGGYTATDLLLGNNSQYHYYSTYLGSNKWQSVFCDGNGCRGMVTGNLGTDRLPYVLSGGESLSGARWGSVTTRYAAYKAFNSTTWQAWCYTNAYVSPSGAGTISVCSSSDHSWISSR